MFGINTDELNNIESQCRKAIRYCEAEYNTDFTNFKLEREASLMLRHFDIDFAGVGFTTYAAEAMFSSTAKAIMKLIPDIKIQWCPKDEDNKLFINGMTVDQLFIGSKDQLGFDI